MKLELGPIGMVLPSKAMLPFTAPVGAGLTSATNSSWNVVHTHSGKSKPKNATSNAYPVALLGATSVSCSATSSEIEVPSAQVPTCCGKPGGAVPVPKIVQLLLPHAFGWAAARACPDERPSMAAPVCGMTFAP